jgi:formylglycine-generating enzyme required for sulfatase activity
MHGNVWEWMEDGRRAYTANTVTDPKGPTDAGAVRAIRGGYWGGDARYVRAAYRNALAPDFRVPVVGFRCLSSGGSR